MASKLKSKAIGNIGSKHGAHRKPMAKKPKSKKFNPTKYQKMHAKVFGTAMSEDKGKV